MELRLLTIPSDVMFGHGKHLAYVIQEGIPLWKYFRVSQGCVDAVRVLDGD